MDTVKVKKGTVTSALVRIEKQPFNIVHCKVLDYGADTVLFELIDVLYKGKWMEKDDDKIHRIETKHFTALTDDKLKSLIGYDRKEMIKIERPKY